MVRMVLGDIENFWKSPPQTWGQPGFSSPCPLYKKKQQPWPKITMEKDILWKTPASWGLTEKLFAEYD